LRSRAVLGAAEYEAEVSSEQGEEGERRGAIPELLESSANFRSEQVG